jgi:hypothetical protein
MNVPTPETDVVALSSKGFQTRTPTTRTRCALIRLMRDGG